MSNRLLVVSAAVVMSIGASACGKSAETRLKNADEATVEAQEKNEKAREAQDEAREADSKAKSEATAATKSVRKERESYREKLQEEIADANAKLAPPSDKPQPSQQDVSRLTEKRNVLNGHLTTVNQGTDKEWPSQKERIKADLDRFDD